MCASLQGKIQDLYDVIVPYFDPCTSRHKYHGLMVLNDIVYWVSEF